MDSYKDVNLSTLCTRSRNRNALCIKYSFLLNVTMQLGVFMHGKILIYFLKLYTILKDLVFNICDRHTDNWVVCIHLATRYTRNTIYIKT